MLTSDLLTEAVAAVRCAALYDESPDYWRLAVEAVGHRLTHRTTYGWPEVGAAMSLHIVAAIAMRARHEDGCRCGEPAACEHLDPIDDSGLAAERG